MNFTKLKIFTNDFGKEKVENVVETLGYTKAEGTDAAEVMGKYQTISIEGPYGSEVIVSLFDTDDEEGAARLKKAKVYMMMLKSKELEGFWGWDVTLGRLYCDDVAVDETNWNEK